MMVFGEQNNVCGSGYHPYHPLMGPSVELILGENLTTLHSFRV